jgi:hypothetical protein
MYGGPGDDVLNVSDGVGSNDSANGGPGTDDSDGGDAGDSILNCEL